MDGSTTIDGFFDGALWLEQPAPGFGYRANEDSLLLASFASRCRPAKTSLIDLGAGVGTVALALHLIHPQTQLTLVEQQPFLADLARNNIVRARLEHVANVVQAEVAVWSDDQPAFDGMVVANPPYTPPHSGRRAIEPSRDAARHGELTPFLHAMGRLIASSQGTACLCYPVSDLLNLITTASRNGLYPVRLAFVQRNQRQDTRLALLELRGRPNTPLVVEPPIVGPFSFPGSPNE